MKLAILSAFLAVVGNVNGQRGAVSEDPPQSEMGSSDMDMQSRGAAAENRCPVGDYKMPRVSMEFRRMEDYTGPIDIWETLPEYTEDPEAINCYLDIINVIARPINFRDPRIISNPDTLAQILTGDPIYEPQAVIDELYVDSVVQYMVEVPYAAGRRPMFPLDKTVLNTTLVSLQGDVIAPLPLVFPYGGIDAETMVALSLEFGHIHMNFWQGLDENGHVDPTLYPYGVEDRFYYLPPYHEADLPLYMFFYMGEGVVCKLRFWVGTDAGWELNYLGMWPHAFIPNDQYNVFFQAPGGDERWIAWYDLNDPTAERTVELYMRQNQAQVSPDYDFILNRNPWLDFDNITVENFGIYDVVYGEDYPNPYARK